VWAAEDARVGGRLRSVETAEKSATEAMSKPFHGGPIELVDCQLHGPGSGAELFVVEGESAALAVERVRDPRFQAVLPMQGKPLNAHKATPRRVAAQPLFRELGKALGTGLGSDFRLAGLRFERLLVLTDPDADGIHCGVLLLAFIHRFLPRLLASPAGGDGIVGWVRAPWGEAAPADGGPPQLAHSEEGLIAVAEQIRREQPVTVRRFRGLAAIDSELLARHCVQPEGRRVDWQDARRVEGMLAMLAAAGVEGPDGMGE